ncbi:MAG: DUF192 domain-containing protein [Nanoarchaeota archaeon]|nr:DUF192 domain-containing protein [Nanoarchaeota archaeon]
MEILCNGVILADRVKICDNIFSKTRGLMLSRPLKKGQGLVLRANEEGVLETTIHMMFVFFGIDVVWVNGGMEVVDVRENIRAFTPLIVPKKAAKYVIELPTGTARHVNVGDVIEFN